MKVYVESNFVLELALLQEQSASCAELLNLCGSDRVALAIPAYSLAEPYETLIRRRNQRRRIKHDLDDELKQIARTATYADRVDRFEELAALLIGSADEGVRRLEDVLTRVIDVAEVVSLDASVLTASIGTRTTFLPRTLSSMQPLSLI